MPSSFQTLLGLFRWTTFRPAAQLRNRLVKLDVPPPLLPNELLLQIIYILQSNGDEKSQGTLYSFLRVSRTCYSMAFRALYQCPYVTVSNCHRFKRSLVKFKNGNMVKRLHLRRLADRRGVEVLIIQECKDGLEEFVAVGASMNDRLLVDLSRSVNLKALDLSQCAWFSSISSFLAILSRFQKLETLSMPKSFYSLHQITYVEPRLHWPPRLTELYMSGQLESSYLRGLSTQLQPFLKVVRLTGSRLRESAVLDMINETGLHLQTLEINASAADICRRNLDGLLHRLPVVRQLNIHICTGYINAEFSGPCMLTDEAISTFRELALDCPSGCPPPKHINWVDGGKVVFIGSMWDRLSKLEVRRHRILFRKTPKKLWNFTNASVCPCHIRELHIPKPTVFKSGLELEVIDSGIQDLFLEPEE